MDNSAPATIRRRRAVGLPASGLLAIAFAATAAAAPHQHGVATLALALDGGQLRAELSLPARDAVGFERRPRNDAERGKLAAARDRLADGATLLGLPSAARCAASAPAEIRSELLGPAPAPGGHKHAHDDEHADFDVVYAFVCAEPGALSGLEPALFKSFPGLKQIRVQSIGPKGPKRATITPARARFDF
ncbi:MAG: DUF2796 domain-containing protein [Alphaproteobacteria bacterium]|nr:DUF2796 domain-containing protein [Alphaproteobacteria bacterium]